MVRRALTALVLLSPQAAALQFCFHPLGCRIAFQSPALRGHGLGICSASASRSEKPRIAAGVALSAGAAPGDGEGAKGRLGKMLQSVLLASFMAFFGVVAVLRPLAFWAGIASFPGCVFCLRT